MRFEILSQGQRFRKRRKKQKPRKPLEVLLALRALILSSHSSSVQASSTALARQLRIAYGWQHFQEKQRKPKSEKNEYALIFLVLLSRGVASEKLMGCMKAFICELAHKEKQADTTSRRCLNLRKRFLRFWSISSF